MITMQIKRALYKARVAFLFLAWVYIMSVYSNLETYKWQDRTGRLIFLAQGHNTVTPVRLESATPRSPDKHSTTEPLRSQCVYDVICTRKIIFTSASASVIFHGVYHIIYINWKSNNCILHVFFGTVMYLVSSHVRTNGQRPAIVCLFVWFDSLRPLNSLSVMRDGLPGLNQY